MFAQERGREHEEPGRAEAALERVARREDLLQRRQLLLVAEPLHRLDVRAVGLHAEHEARADRLPVQQHRARTADALLAPDVRAGVAEIVAEHVDERSARLDLHLVRRAVDGERDAVPFGHAASPTATPARARGSRRAAAPA